MQCALNIFRAVATVLLMALSFALLGPEPGLRASPAKQIRRG